MRSGAERRILKPTSKILLLDKTGTFVSCLIMPGLTLSAQSLSNKAALLPEVSLIAPNTILAKNTLTAMNAGIVYGHADMILGLINRYEKELGSRGMWYSITTARSGTKCLIIFAR